MKYKKLLGTLLVASTLILSACGGNSSSAGGKSSGKSGNDDPFQYVRLYSRHIRRSFPFLPTDVPFDALHQCRQEIYRQFLENLLFAVV